MTEPKKLEGMRFSTGKMNFWSQIPKDALIEIMRVYHIGGIKYDPSNWLKGMKYSEMANPLERHWILWSLGDTKDAETRCHHLAHVAWNAIGLLTYELRQLGLDDRTKLPIGYDFSWLSGPAKELDLGLSKAELDELAVKYAKNKEEFKKGDAPQQKVETKGPPPDVETIEKLADALEARNERAAKNAFTDAFIDAIGADDVCPILSINHIDATLTRYVSKETEKAGVQVAVDFEEFLTEYTRTATNYCRANRIPVDVVKFRTILTQARERHLQRQTSLLDTSKQREERIARNSI